MKKPLLLLLFCLILVSALGQKINVGKISDSLAVEGKKLYRSEMASWYGTDVFVDKCTNKRPLSGGYLSYDKGDSVINIFFSKGDSPMVLATMGFDKTFNVNTCKIDTASRQLTNEEVGLYTIRQKAFAELKADTMFKHYQKTDMNLIPIIGKNFRRVYILTGPQENGVVILGNDYLIEFNENNEIVSKRSLHKNPLFFRKDPNNPAVSTVHSHLPSTGDFITATDICTIMLYEKFAGWKFHVVISKNYVSSWDCQTDKFVILTREAWERIGKSDNK